MTFNWAELTGHTIIVVIFLKSMQETVQVKITSSTLIKLFGGWGHGICDISESILNIEKRLNPSIKYILQHVVQISANSEMVELEPLLKLVELSWNDPKLFAHIYI